MKVLLTGAGGFLGGRVLHLLHQGGVRVVAVTRRSISALPGVLQVKADLAEIDLNAVVDSDVDAICHVAASVSLGRRMSDLEACVRDNVVVTNKLIEFALRRRIRRFVLSSTVSVYQRPVRRIPIDESYPTSAPSFYAASKLFNELALQADEVRAQIASFALRCGSVYGPGMREGSVLPVMVARARLAQSIQIQGNGRRSQDFVYVDDVAQAHVAALSAHAPAGAHIYNVASGIETSLDDLADAALDVFSHPAAPRLVERLPSATAEEDRFFLDVTRLRRDLRVFPIGLRDGLRRMKLARDEEQRCD